MIKKNEIPVLEYDTESEEIINPDHGKKPFLPERCVFAFLGDTVERYAVEHGAVIADEYETVSKTFRFYTLTYAGEEVCLVQAPIGAPAATAMLDTLIASGCRKIVAAGSCGVLVPMEENAFLIPERALRAEGTSYQYLEPSRFIDLDEGAVRAVERTFEELEIPCIRCVTWTTDGFFRETRDMVRWRIEEGCSVVEMECSALTACARKRGALFGQFLFTADSLENADLYDARNFGKDSHEKALDIALRAVMHL